MEFSFYPTDSPIIAVLLPIFAFILYLFSAPMNNSRVPFVASSSSLFSCNFVFCFFIYLCELLEGKDWQKPNHTCKKHINMWMDTLSHSSASNIFMNRIHIKPFYTIIKKYKKKTTTKRSKYIYCEIVCTMNIYL